MNSNKYFIFKIEAVSSKSSDSYNIPQSSREVLSALELTEDVDIWNYFKSKLLEFSIHKGSVIGFQSKKDLILIDLHIPLFPQLQQLEDGGKYELILEHEHASNDELICHIERKKEDLTNMKVSEAVKGRIRKRLVKDFAYSSNKIEGNTLTKYEVDEMFNIIEKRPAFNYDQLDNTMQVQVKSHFDISLEMLDRVASATDITAINLEFLLNLHRAMDFSGLSEDHRRRYRTVRNYIPASAFTHPDDVQEEMAKFIKWLHDQRNRSDTIKVAVEAHYKFVTIRPFQVGNGRIGRLLVNAILAINKYPTISIIPGIKDRYFEALSQIDRTSDDSYLVRIIAEAVLRSLDITEYYYKQTNEN